MTNDRTETTPQHRSRKFGGKKLRTSLPKPQAEQETAPRKDAERIAKVMARAGVASRREAEAWIAAGRVSVNGGVISSPALNVKASDRISIDGKPMPQRERTRLFLFHKPRGLVTTSADTHGRPTIFGALPSGLPRLISVGRLDLNTEGLLLLTNDGGLARALELPATGWLRRYRVRAFGDIAQDRLDGLRNGIAVDGVNYGAIEATLDRVQGSNVWITFAMREGKNREIRNVLRALGLQVNRLIRVSFGPFQLGELAEGAIEEVKTRTLREQIGARLAAQAGADFSSDIVEREEQAQPKFSPRHPEARGAERQASKRQASKRQASKGDGPRMGDERPSKDRGRSSFEARKGRPPQDDGSKGGARGARHDRHRDDKPRGGDRPHRGDVAKGGGPQRRDERPVKDRGRSFEGRPNRPPRDDAAKGGGRREGPRKGHRPYHGKRDH